MGERERKLNHVENNCNEEFLRVDWAKFYSRLRYRKTWRERG